MNFATAGLQKSWPQGPSRDPAPSTVTSDGFASAIGEGMASGTPSDGAIRPAPRTATATQVAEANTVVASTLPDVALDIASGQSPAATPIVPPAETLAVRAALLSSAAPALPNMLAAQTVTIAVQHATTIPAPIAASVAVPVPPAADSADAPRLGSDFGPSAPPEPLAEAAPPVTTLPRAAADQAKAKANPDTQSTGIVSTGSTPRTPAGTPLAVSPDVPAGMERGAGVRAATTDTPLEPASPDVTEEKHPSHTIAVKPATTDPTGGTIPMIPTAPSLPSDRPSLAIGSEQLATSARVSRDRPSPRSAGAAKPSMPTVTTTTDTAVPIPVPMLSVPLAVPVPPPATALAGSRIADTSVSTRDAATLSSAAAADPAGSATTASFTVLLPEADVGATPATTIVGNGTNEPMRPVIVPPIATLISSGAPAHVPTISAQPGHIGQDLGVEIARRISVGGAELVVRLDPAELGRIEVRMSFDDRGGLRTVIAADSPVALDMLRRDSADLSRSLSDAGFRSDGQSLRFDGGGDRGSGQSRSPWQNGPSKPDEPDGFGTSAAFEQTPYRSLRTSGRYDVIA